MSLYIDFNEEQKLQTNKTDFFLIIKQFNLCRTAEEASLDTEHIGPD